MYRHNHAFGRISIDAGGEAPMFWQDSVIARKTKQAFFPKRDFLKKERATCVCMYVFGFS